MTTPNPEHPDLPLWPPEGPTWDDVDGLSWDELESAGRPDDPPPEEPTP